MYKLISIPVLAWKFEAEQMCQFTRQEFVNGCKALKTDSCKGIQTKLPEVVIQTLADQEKFKELYRFTYKVSITRGQHLEYNKTSGFGNLRFLDVCLVSIKQHIPNKISKIPA